MRLFGVVVGHLAVSEEENEERGTKCDLIDGVGREGVADVPSVKPACRDHDDACDGQERGDKDWHVRAQGGRLVLVLQTVALSAPPRKGIVENGCNDQQRGNDTNANAIIAVNVVDLGVAQYSLFDMYNFIIRFWE